MDGLFEPGAVHLGEGLPATPVDVVAQVSIAISLKRIADELCGTAGYTSGPRLGLTDTIFQTRNQG